MDTFLSDALPSLDNVVSLYRSNDKMRQFGKHNLTICVILMAPPSLLLSTALVLTLVTITGTKLNADSLLPISLNALGAVMRHQAP
jgi:hypothetical protein